MEGDDYGKMSESDRDVEVCVLNRAQYVSHEVSSSTLLPTQNTQTITTYTKYKFHHGIAQAVCQGCQKSEDNC